MSARHRKYWRNNPAAEALNTLLNASEGRLRKRIGAEGVNALIEQFRAAANDYPPLFYELYAKRDPYRWLAQYWAPRQALERKGREVLRSVIAQRSQH